MKRINCKICKYYFVTWNKNKPHGCKAFGFKSLNIPSIVVRQSSGMACHMFIEKNFDL
jgi:hypothetical protein